MSKLKIIRGNDAVFRVTITAGGIPLNLSEVSLRCEVREAPGGRKLFDAIIQEEDYTNGTFNLIFPSYETSKLTAGSVVFFDIRIIFRDNTVVNVPSPPFSAVIVEPVTK